MQKLISHGNTEITEEIKVFPCFSCLRDNIMLRYAQKRGSFPLISQITAEKYPFNPLGSKESLLKHNACAKFN
ncbi:putative thioredoxin/glutaredoxin [Flavobacterium sp. W4I14]|nr:putative thioredoxin/glutaredoxin [Flavobacterium sp. W4I14]